jgi:hypothetical protein
MIRIALNQFDAVFGLPSILLHGDFGRSNKNPAAVHFRTLRRDFSMSAGRFT